ncbi:MAG: efflux transporter outer membrane subunit [Akkermansiaceae bacterium]|nr:efflux transporter outer membrane subunit [Akkermansiaceae bacterium]
MQATKPIFIAATALAIVGCAPVGPDYVKPEFRPSQQYKSSTSSHFGVSSSWWQSFRDPELNRLQGQLLAQNLDLAAAHARRKQALAQLGITASAVYPQLNATGSATRHKSSQAGLSGSQLSEYYSLYDVGGYLSYEMDLWGRVRRLVEAGKADAEAAGFAVADARVSLQTQLARQYFALRFLDEEISILAQAVETRKVSVKITNERHQAGLTSELDTARAKSELANARADLLALKGPRATLENSIAVLLGQQPSAFRIRSRSSRAYLPTVPAGVPAALLYRRPDVAVAERKVAAATARIGLAEAERYPKFSLTGSAGSNAVSSKNFLGWSSQFFSIGPSVSVPLFQGKRIKSGILLSQAQREEALANYQKTVLSAIADVESAVASLQALKGEASARHSAVEASARTLELSSVRYKEGATNYLDVADAQRSKLSAQRAAVRTRGQQFGATIQLIQALGGGFSRGK